eukprot:CAMPEP_0114352958 /NCGR_PEP_ID=MMETSP0101-20121206/18320_1 /TAXON_ID=38822 ORGANISM="Pteridomonas danica, Strain PT" /NCGR_SAMPLE_ID=MMETSP0101 /ASSEMBLY_ACC=CAM_ASM_000211 /LENGTH=58 /DNA_ID=CAMNT_0001493587 /DNA_START=826 /DNA_END=998 /DNA_ORIENTATION=+
MTTTMRNHDNEYDMHESDDSTKKNIKNKTKEERNKNKQNNLFYFVAHDNQDDIISKAG